ncbi:hypothetical protein AB4028_11550 [Janibacter sp. RAF20_2_2]|uniref:hypothetical protein n=1 Tax=unclassified Janibacter TaxID=2649294 RepID=UPI003F9159C9
MELLRDVTCGGWLLARVGDWGRVGGVAGAGFAAYARVLHPVPVTRLDLSDVDTWGMPRVLEETRWPWAEVASRQGLTMHPLVQFNRLADLHSGVQFADGWQVGQTCEGCLDVDLLAGLTGHLREATATPDDLVAGIWAGWGELSGSASVVYLSDDAGLQGWWARRRMQRESERRRAASLRPEVRRAVRRGPFLQLPGRECLLFATSSAELADPTWPGRAGIGVMAEAPELGPQIIWPAGREWVVASEIDWDSTIVAGSRELVDAVLADERFEAYEVDESSDLTWEGDLINPPRAGWSAGP